MGSNQLDFENVDVPSKSINDATPEEWDEVSKLYWQKAEDPNVNKVIDSMIRRANEGLQKYGVTTSGNPLDLVQWLRHLQEELMDATIYIERTIKELKK